MASPKKYRQAMHPYLLHVAQPMKDLQTDASQHIAAIARWDNEGGACNVLSKKTDAELKKRPRSKRNDREPTDG
jgi:hypothetical protein